jgi:hypothetical protein
MAIWYILPGVVEKHDFRGIQQKILQISDFPIKRDLNPLPNGNNAADIAKTFANFFCQNWFSGRKTQFLQNSDRISVPFAKIVFG